MKKYYLFIAAMLAVCICSALACSSVHKTETTPTAQPTAQPTEWQAGHQVPQPDCTSRSRQHESDRAGKITPLLFHLFYTPFTVVPPYTPSPAF